MEGRLRTYHSDPHSCENAAEQYRRQVVAVAVVVVVVVVEEEEEAAVAGAVDIGMHLEIIALCLHAPAVAAERTFRMMHLQYKNSRQCTSESYMSCLTGCYSLCKGQYSCKGSWALGVSSFSVMSVGHGLLLATHERQKHTQDEATGASKPMASPFGSR